MMQYILPLLDPSCMYVGQARTRKRLAADDAPVRAGKGSWEGTLSREALALFGSAPSDLMGAEGPRHRAKRPAYGEQDDAEPPSCQKRCAHMTYCSAFSPSPFALCARMRCSNMQRRR